MLSVLKKKKDVKIDKIFRWGITGAFSQKIAKILGGFWLDSGH
jgi:hypothetical protein